MLDISRPEKYLILILIIVSTFLVIFSYRQKLTFLPGIKTISIENIEGRININTATALEFERLHGVGPILAERIIAYRDTLGGFKTKEELKNVIGIGDKTFEGIKDIISLND